MVTLISLGNGFWVVNTWQAPVRKWLKRSTLNFAHTFLTTATQNRAHIFSNNELFICFESVFSMKTVKGWIFKKIFRRKKIPGSLVCHLVDYILVKQNYGKLQYRWCILLIFGEHKGKLHILKKVDVST